MRGALLSLGVLCLLLLTASTWANAADTTATASSPTLTVKAYPQALPNDGRSEAEITVTAVDATGGCVADIELTGNVANSDGMLRERSVTTDRDGKALFHYRAGISARPARITFADATGAGKCEVQMPLAAVSYLDLLLVTPAEYDAYKRRQASAAPIYKLSLDVFPQQLAADGGSTAHVTATLTFTDGRPAPGVPLKAEVSGSDSRVDTSQVATDATGRMSFYFTAGRTAGTATVRIVEPSTGLVASASLLLVEAGPARIELTVGDQHAIDTAHDGTLLPADGFTELPLKIRVTDLYGMALSGVEVKVEVIDMGSGWVELRSSVSDSFGELSGVYHCGSATGKVRLRAFAAAGLPATL